MCKNNGNIAGNLKLHKGIVTIYEKDEIISTKQHELLANKEINLRSKFPFLRKARI